MPRIPNAAISEQIARTNGTTEATIAPNANSRMMKVSGIVSDSVESRPLLMSALMSSLMNVLLIAWIRRSGRAARAVARIGSTGAMSGVTRVSSPSIRPTIRTVEPSGETSPACGGAVNGSASWLKVGVWTPSSGAPDPWRAVTSPPTVVLKAGSDVAPGAPPTTTMTCSNGSFVPPALKTSYALLASICFSFGFAFASEALIPPIEMLITRSPTVATNHSAATGHRCRALHIAMRTVAGSRPVTELVALTDIRFGLLAGESGAGPFGQSLRGCRQDHDLRVGAFRGEGEQPNRLVLKCSTVGRGDRFERGDRHRRPPAVANGPPGPGVHAIDQDRAHRAAVPGQERDAATGRDDARPVGVADQHVVVLGQETRRSGRVGVRPRSVRQVEQLASAGPVPERGQRGSQVVHHLPAVGHARPRADVRDARRSERGEIPDDPVARIR